MIVYPEVEIKRVLTADYEDPEIDVITQLVDESGGVIKKKSYRLMEGDIISFKKFTKECF